MLRTVVHCHWVNSSQLAGPPWREPLPDAPRPEPSTPAPIRFLPEYDNVLLSHADRSRFVTEGRGRRIAGRVQGTVLFDGRLAAVWRLDRDARAAQLVVTPLERPTKRATASIAAEGRRLLRLIAADDDRRDVRIETFEP